MYVCFTDVCGPKGYRKLWLEVRHVTVRVVSLTIISENFRQFIVIFPEISNHSYNLSNAARR